MIQDNYISSTHANERKFSVRLAKKRNDNLSVPLVEHSQTSSLSTLSESSAENNNTYDSEKIENSKQFLNCLELKPVNLDQDFTAGNFQDIVNLNTAAPMVHLIKYKKKLDLPATKETDSDLKLCKVKKRTKKDIKQTMKMNNAVTENKENVATQVCTMYSGSFEKNENAVRKKEADHLEKENAKVSSSTSDNVSDQKYILKVTHSNNKEDDKLKQIYIFRDVNRIAPIEEKPLSLDVARESNMLFAVDLNRHGKKRRYDKLMKKLEDGEKTIESNLKEVRMMEDGDADKEDIDTCVEKLKEKLRVREKKKYEYLINYMQDQWKVDQQSFQDLLPQKVELVKANVVKQLGAQADKAAEKRLRGRPKKLNMSQPDERKEEVAKKPKISNSKKTGIVQTRKSSVSERGFPVKFPKSLLPDSSLVQNRQKIENFRLGIVDKDGGQKIIELNCDTMKGTPKTFNYNSQSKPQNKDDSNVHDIPKLFVSSNVPVKTPSTSITLPSISSLEKDYELVSLLPSCPESYGDVKSDHFYIPQSTFDTDGKTSMIIVGPFRMAFEPKPHLILVPPEQFKKGPAMILRKKIRSPSQTPPRDFRIHRDTSQNFRLSEKLPADTQLREHCDPAVVAHDHDYMTPLALRDNVRRYCKAVAKHSANAKFIDARVEDITKEEDNLLVTIKGDNMLRRVKNLSSFVNVPMQNNEDGIPIAYTLDQIMTTTLQKAQSMSKREELVFESTQSGDYGQVLFPLSSMGDVVMEVMIPPGGTETTTRSKLKSADDVNRIQTSASMCDIAESGANDDTSVKFLNSMECIDCDAKDSNDTLTGFIHDDNALKVDSLIPIENEAAVDSAQRPGLKCCKVCLRLFPSDYVLFTHVRSHHATCETRDAVYLEELRARSHLACPVCCDPPLYFATPSKLRQHLRQLHGIENYVETCKFCRSEFMDKNELELHIDLSHNTFSSRGLVSLFNPTHQLLRNERALLSCSRCNIVFGDRSSLLGHTLKVHPELNQFNICRLCDKVFDSGPSLHKHLKKAHEQTHAGELKCPFCPAWLPNMELASVHRLTLHSGAVPVHCPFCGAGYQSLHPMYNHVRIQHLQTEAHICPECQDTFPSSRILSEHARKVHLISPRIMKDTLLGANSTTYCCPFCTVSFMRTYDLAVHVINSHRDHLLPAQCHLCMQSFVNDMVVKMHMSGAHGIDMDDGEYETRDSGVLDEDGSLYSHSKSFVNRIPSRRIISRHIINHEDMLETQAGRYLEELEDHETETIVYLNERNEVVNTGEMFSNCSAMEDVQLLSQASEEFNLQAVDYLETLSNDSIAVGADVVADVSMEEMTTGRGVLSRTQELLGMTSQFEIDGVLYELATSHDVSSSHHLHATRDMMDMDSDDLRVSEGMSIDSTDFAHLLEQQGQ
uniref:C2H2-type domain-containing protein n=1 Tax=Biomphalaria glabrata TaxID=6526 RepID=A0A2C9KV47_BIOGL